jgi:hypothetical protein
MAPFATVVESLMMTYMYIVPYTLECTCKFTISFSLVEELWEVGLPFSYGEINVGSERLNDLLKLYE